MKLVAWIFLSLILFTGFIGFIIHIMVNNKSYDYISDDDDDDSPLEIGYPGIVTGKQIGRAHV